jgi:hypothetical protein
VLTNGSFSLNNHPIVNSASTRSQDQQSNKAFKRKTSVIAGATSANVGAPKKEVSPNVIQDYRDTFEDQ